MTDDTGGCHLFHFPQVPQHHPNPPGKPNPRLLSTEILIVLLINNLKLNSHSNPNLTFILIPVEPLC